MGAARLTVAVAMAVLAAGCDDTGVSVGPLDTTASGEHGVVARVNDGDTLTLVGGDKVRLVQIDAPELLAECYGRPALRALADIVPAGTDVRLVRDPGLDERDVHGRLLRYVFVGRLNVNLELVRRGAASPYFFRGQRGRHARTLLRAVASARRDRRGYWKACPAARLDPRRGSITGRS